VEVFVDHARHLWRRNINVVPTKPPQLQDERASEIDQVLLATPSLSRCSRRRIAADLHELCGFLTKSFSSPQKSEVLKGSAAGQGHVEPAAVLDRQITAQPAVALF
jgi:hypothetical protein